MSTKEVLKPYFDTLRRASLDMSERQTLEGLEDRVADLVRELEAAKKVERERWENIPKAIRPKWMKLGE